MRLVGLRALRGHIELIGLRATMGLWGLEGSGLL